MPDTRPRQETTAIPYPAACKHRGSPRVAGPICFHLDREHFIRCDDDWSFPVGCPLEVKP